MKIRTTTAISLLGEPVPQDSILDLDKETAVSFIESGLAVYANPSDAPPSPTPTSDTPSESETVSSDSTGQAGGSEMKSTEPPAKPTRKKRK